jgi:hypothetical protein
VHLVGPTVLIYCVVLRIFITVENMLVYAADIVERRISRAVFSN